MDQDREAGSRLREAGLKTERSWTRDREGLDSRLDRERLDSDQFHKVVASYVLLKGMCLPLSYVSTLLLSILWQLRPQTLHSLAPGNSFSLACSSYFVRATWF